MNDKLLIADEIFVFDIFQLTGFENLFIVSYEFFSQIGREKIAIRPPGNFFGLFF